MSQFPQFMKAWLSPAANLCMYFPDSILSAPSLEPSLGCSTLQLTMAVNKKLRVSGHSHALTVAHRQLRRFCRGKNFLRALCPTVPSASVANVKILAQGTNTGPSFKVEDLSVYL